VGGGVGTNAGKHIKRTVMVRRVKEACLGTTQANGGAWGGENSYAATENCYVAKRGGRNSKHAKLKVKRFTSNKGKKPARLNDCFKPSSHRAREKKAKWKDCGASVGGHIAKYEREGELR